VVKSVSFSKYLTAVKWSELTSRGAIFSLKLDGQYFAQYKATNVLHKSKQVDSLFFHLLVVRSFEATLQWWGRRGDVPCSLRIQWLGWDSKCAVGISSPAIGCGQDSDCMLYFCCHYLASIWRHHSNFARRCIICQSESLCFPTGFSLFSSSLSSMRIF
jgi:hypothetical protein